jgi:two-component system KDP operon response regulator KdpE
MHMRRVAVISRHERLAEELRPEFELVHISPDRYDPDAYTNGSAPDAYLVDATESDHLELVAHLASHAERPVVVLGSESRAAHASEYLETGADAYLACGAPTEEWTARLRAVTRRYRRPGQASETVDYTAGDIAIQRDSRRVLVGGTEVRLTRTEFNLLVALAEQMDEVVPHRKLMAQVWGPEYLSARHYLRVYVRRLREKLERDPEQPVLLVAERGRGYMLRSTPLAEGVSV